MLFQLTVAECAPQIQINTAMLAHLEFIPLPITCIHFPLVSSCFSYRFLLSSRQSTFWNAWNFSRTATPMQSAALILVVNQSVPQKRSDSPTRPARGNVEQVPRAPSRTTLYGHFPHGCFPGWLFLASSLSVPQIPRMYSSQVSSPSISQPISSLIMIFPHPTSYH